jgi:hypothetical protein
MSNEGTAEDGAGKSVAYLSRSGEFFLVDVDRAVELWMPASAASE